MALGPGASLTILMNELMVVEAPINQAIPGDYDKIELGRWRPSGIDPPALYHDIASAPLTTPDTGTLRDTISILARIAITQDTDEKEYGDQLEVYSDAFREVVDPALMQRGRPMNGACLWADRTDFRTVLDSFNEIPYLAMEFILQFRLERAITG